LDDDEVERVPTERSVTPLNSPVHYPQHNVSIEKGIREMKGALGESLPQAVRWPPEQARPSTLAVRHAFD
jgi:hypothetical protein